MDWDIQRIHSQRVQPASGIAPDVPKVDNPSEPFDKVLEKVKRDGAKPSVTFSSHASKRLMQRGITLDRTDLERIDAAFDRAAEKGAKDSLFILRDLALLVSVENRTVITALHGESAKENVFTQIDSAVML